MSFAHLIFKEYKIQKELERMKAKKVMLNGEATIFCRVHLALTLNCEPAVAGRFKDGRTGFPEIQIKSRFLNK